MNVTPSNCQAFIQVWVDVNSLQQGTTNGCYAVCNRSQQSTGEGTPELQASVVSGTNVCWSVLPIDPQYNGQFTITSVGAESGWQTPPAPVQGSPNMFTGTLTQSTVGGNVNSNIVFSFNGSGGGQTVTLPVSIIPVSVQ